jgi:hypothetical protein
MVYHFWLSQKELNSLIKYCIKMIWKHKSFYPNLEGDSLSLSFHDLEAVIFLYFLQEIHLSLELRTNEFMDKMAFKYLFAS